MAATALGSFSICRSRRLLSLLSAAAATTPAPPTMVERSVDTDVLVAAMVPPSNCTMLWKSASATGWWRLQIY